LFPLGDSDLKGALPSLTGRTFRHPMFWAGLIGAFLIWQLFGITSSIRALYWPSPERQRELLELRLRGRGAVVYEPVLADQDQDIFIFIGRVRQFKATDRLQVFRGDAFYEWYGAHGALALVQVPYGSPGTALIGFTIPESREPLLLEKMMEIQRKRTTTSSEHDRGN